MKTLNEMIKERLSPINIEIDPSNIQAIITFDPSDFHQKELVEKPPLGLRPRFIVEENRAKEVQEAIDRYHEAGKEVPAEWLEEKSYLQRRAWLHQQRAIEHHRKIKGNLMVKGRNGFNDVNVGEWVSFPDIDPPTFKGLYDWCDAPENGQDSSKLISDASFADPHLVGYGDHYQFWVATDSEYEEQMKGMLTVEGKKEQSAVMVCEDDSGDVGLTKGKSYSVLGGENGLIRVENDLGQVQEYFPERFKKA